MEDDCVSAFPGLCADVAGTFRDMHCGISQAAAMLAAGMASSIGSRLAWGE